MCILTFVGGTVAPAASGDLFLSALVEEAASVLLSITIFELWLGVGVEEGLLLGHTSIPIQE